MKIPIGIFFGGATSAREQSFQTAQRVFKQLGQNNFDPIAIFVDPFGQLIFLEDGIPSGKDIATFYPSEKYFTPEGRTKFGIYPEHLGALGASERAAMAKETGKLLKPAKLPELISIAFLALPDVQHIQEYLQDLRIPHTGESAALTKILSHRFAFRKQLQDLAYPLPAALRLSTSDWQENSLQAIWGPDSVSVNYPLLIRPSHQYATGRSTVVTAKDGPEGLRRAIDLAFGQRRLAFEHWLDMNPVDRENWVRHLAQWSSGIGFPLSLQLEEETKVFQKPASLLAYLNELPTTLENPQLVFKNQQVGTEIMVSSLVEGTAVSCLLFRDQEQDWQVQQLRFLGGASAITAGTETFPITKKSTPRVSASLRKQVEENCQKLAKDLQSEAGIRVFGILNSNGELIPEEIQAFFGPNAEEKIDKNALKDFVIASLYAQQEKDPDPTYRSLLETLTVAKTTSGAAPSEEEVLPEATEVATPIIKITPDTEAPPPTELNIKQEEPIPDPPIQEELYQRELEKLNKEQEVMKEATPVYTASPAEDPEDEDEKVGFWLSFKAFFTSGLLWRNVAAMAVLGILLFLLVNLGLKSYTRHGDSMQLENYIGLTFEDAQKRAEAKDLKMVVQTTYYESGKQANEIFAQYPDPLSKIKENRTIFVSVYRGQGEKITLPTFTEVGDDFESYRRELRNKKVDLVVRDQVFNGKLAEGTILHLFLDGDKKKITNTELRQGITVEQGSKVEAVITTRTSKYVGLPNLVCKTFDEASFNLTGINLVVGKVIGGNDSNRGRYYVWKQEPAYDSGKLVTKGTQVNVYLTITKPENCQ